MKLTAKLLYYTTILHTPKGHRAETGEKEGEISCRVRTYLHEDKALVEDGEAIREETHVLLDSSLPKNWNESDLRKALAKKLNLGVE